MNILIVHNYYKIRAGEETVLNNEIALLKQHGNNVISYTRDNRELDNYSKLRKITLPFVTLFSIRTYIDVKRLIKKHNIDIVHVHNNICLVSPSVFYAAFHMNVPVVQTIHHFRMNCPGASLFRDGHICEECIEKSEFHGVKYRCYKNSLSNTLAVALMNELHKKLGTYRKVNFICLTEFNKKKLLEINKKKNQYIDEKRVYVKPNFSSFAYPFVPYEKRKNEIIYAGRLYPTKGIKILFKAWKSIGNYNLVVFGTGPEEEWCKKYIKNNGISNIKMMGVVNNTELPPYIAGSKALILPTQWYEGFPMVLVESFACGTPVLGSKIGNVGSIIQEGVNGFHFDQRSAASIVDAVGRLCDICETTIKTSEVLYSPEANYKMLMEIYYNVKKA